ncbi:Octaprenyl-diphosphate synthase [Limihaloglobus sulfuriphilus]|uniref:Octaprenyl-diphosphate synthase n=1 Tax=Limihaloglobus sulfuriphilus TaxID=1851148 RepID=A0A1Q2MJ13_9BACT|nr:polyprenyl synthetase family protein [Limihaloglobus sulfuriphilus]AQQ72367.1 Octaprenyl-diphosphate synthase [Limihaloglobus sulfuriphilus]
MKTIDQTVKQYESAADNMLNAVEVEFNSRLENLFCGLGDGSLTPELFSGKRLRSRLFVIFALSGGLSLDAEPDTCSLAAAVELLHEASLLHDDVIDSAQIRRHKPSVSSADGNKKAVLLGDLLITEAFSAIPDGFISKTVGLFVRTTANMCRAELSQINSDPMSGMDKYLEIIGGKTASLFSLGARLGALAGGCSASESASAAEFGRAFGIAYQMADDYCDMFAASERTGKPRFQDIKTGIATLPLIVAKEVMPPNEFSRLLELISDSQADAAAELLREHRVDYYASRLIKDSCGESFSRLWLEESDPAFILLKSLSQSCFGEFTYL